jgi:predicted small metal-binding protein
MWHRDATIPASHRVSKKRRATMAEYKCNMGDKCEFEVKDKDREELVQLVALHAERTHNMKRPLPPNIMTEVDKQIKK